MAYTEEMITKLIHNLNNNLISIQNLSTYLKDPIRLNDNGLQNTLREFSKNLDGISEILKNPSESFEKLKNISYEAGDLAGSVKDLYNLLAKPLRIDDKDLARDVISLRQEIKLMNEYMSKILNGEIKFIGEKLHKIEERLKKMESSQKKEIELSFRCDGYELVKKPISHQKEDPIEDPEKYLGELLKTFSANETTVLIRRFGLFGYKAATFKKIAEDLNLSIERIRQIESRALRKCRHPSRKDLVMNCGHKELINCIMGEVV